MRNTSIESQTYQWSLREPAALLTSALFALFWGCAHSPSANALGEEPAQDESAGGAEVHVTGVLGSPSATTTLPGNQLPAPAPKFGGRVLST